MCGGEEGGWGVDGDVGGEIDLTERREMERERKKKQSNGR